MGGGARTGEQEGVSWTRRVESQVAYGGELKQKSRESCSRGLAVSVPYWGLEELKNRLSFGGGEKIRRVENHTARGGGKWLNQKSRESCSRKRFELNQESRESSNRGVS